METADLLIAVHQQIFRDGIKAIFEDRPTFSVVAESEGKNEIINLCHNNKIDIIVLDLQIPGIDAAELTKEITENYPDIKILSMSTEQDHGIIREIFQAGAHGFMFKDGGTNELVEALETIKQGNHYFSNEAAYSLVKGFSGSDGSSQGNSARDLLTERESEVLELICQELTNREIAEELKISVRTVDAHRRNLLQKTDARNTVGLVKYAVKYQLIEL